MRATLLLLWAEGIQGILLFCSQLVSMNCCDGSWFHRGVAESQFHHIWQADTVQLLLVRSQQLHHGTFCTASSPGTILPAVHPSTPITFYIPDEIFDILPLCWKANKTSDWEILVIVAVAVMGVCSDKSAKGCRWKIGIFGDILGRRQNLTKIPIFFSSQITVNFSKHFPVFL